MNRRTRYAAGRTERLLAQVAGDSLNSQTLKAAAFALRMKDRRSARSAPKAASPTAGGPKKTKATESSKDHGSAPLKCPRFKKPFIFSGTNAINIPHTNLYSFSISIFNKQKSLFSASSFYFSKRRRYAFNGGAFQNGSDLGTGNPPI